MAGLDIRQCKNCNKPFQFYSSFYCRNCLDLMDEYYGKVRDYLFDHPTADVTTISEGAEVDEKYIMQFLREGRLVLAKPEATGLRCMGCGKAVMHGGYCDACKGSMAQSMGSMVERDRPAPVKPRRGDPGKSAKGMHIDIYKNR